MGIVDGHYRYTQDLLQLEAKHTTSLCPSLPRGPTPLILEALSVYLTCHPDQLFASYLHHGLCHGFHIGFDRSSPLRTVSHNHPSSEDNPSIVTAHIRDELQAGRLVGPVERWHLPHVQTNPVGLVPKPHSNKWRLICLRPMGGASMMAFLPPCVHYNMRQLTMPSTLSCGWEGTLNW